MIPSIPGKTIFLVWQPSLTVKNTPLLYHHWLILNKFQVLRKRLKFFIDFFIQQCQPIVNDLILSTN